MSATVVTSQAELDAALADPDVTTVDIRSTDGVWLTLGPSSKQANVRGGGWADVSDGGRADVSDGGWANVSDGGWADVRGGGRANVSDGGWANVSDGGWADVRGGGRANVSDGGWANVRGGGRADVRGGGRANVSDGGWADVRGGGRADVRGASSVHAYGGEVRAGSHVAVHLHSVCARVEGGVIIDHTAVDQSDPATWCSYHGVTVDDGHAVLCKAVRQDWRSAHGTSYEPGTTASCEDFRADGECGRGLHVSPTPTQAATYDHEATRYVEVHVQLAEINIIGPDKCKAASMQCVREVDVHGRPIVAEVGAST